MVQRHLRVRSRNYSNKPLREIAVPITTIYRAGSITPTEQITTKKRYIEINSADACRISSSKIEMKKRFVHGHIETPQFFMVKSAESCKSKCLHYLIKWKHGIIAKRYNSSKGNGLFLIKNEEDLNEFLQGKSNVELKKWIFEKFSTFSREYRLHVTQNGCFYACRKMLKNDADIRWHRHDENSVWITENNELFRKPSNWDTIVKGCVNALKSVGLDIAAFDIKVQSKEEDPKYLILECNSAPGLGEIGIEKYKQELQNIINQKYQQRYGFGIN